MSATDLASGKGHRDENFPVASHLIHPRHRGAILAFYHFVRAADDVADHPTSSEAEKLRLLDRLEAGLLGRHDDEAAANALRAVLRERKVTPQHAQDLLHAFRMDVTKQRYADWSELMHYCRYSAMPVGRYVLDIHGEDRATWVASDALCAALQVINHLQDCGKDFRKLDRVYVPQDALAAAGARTEELGAERASPALRACLQGLAHRTEALMGEAAPLRLQVRDTRLGLEIAAIDKLARTLVRMLQERDPLSDAVHLRKRAFLATALGAAAGTLVQRAARAVGGRRDKAQAA